MALTRVDDLDGSPAQQVLIGYKGKLLSLDLGEANAAKLEKAIRPFLAIATEVGSLPDGGIPAQALAQTPAPVKRTAARGPRRSRPVVAPTQKNVRDWANSNGFTVNAKGRIPANILEAYAAAN